MTLNSFGWETPKTIWEPDGSGCVDLRVWDSDRDSYGISKPKLPLNYGNLAFVFTIGENNDFRKKAMFP